MKEWGSLSEGGQIRRLRSLAMSALESYRIRSERLTLIGGFTNVLFRVDTPEGPYALRVDLQRDHSDGDVDNELSWLAALRSETDLDVARFVPAADASRYVYAGGRGIPQERRCVLFEWVPGRCLGDRPTEVGYHKLGELSAGLHDHGAGFTPPHPPLTWNRIFYWPEEIDPVVVFDADRAHLLAGGRREMLDRAIALANPAFDCLDPSDAQTIHGDLHPDNVHVYHNRLIAFDFEDVSWGHPVQDVAITLFYERNHPGYTDLRAAFEEGYRTVGTWPVAYDGQLEQFMAARTIMFVNYVANLHEDPSDYYSVAFPRLERFIQNWST